MSESTMDQPLPLEGSNMDDEDHSNKSDASSHKTNSSPNNSDNNQSNSESSESDSSSSNSSSSGSESESESDKSNSKSDGVSDEGDRYHTPTESESESPSKYQPRKSNSSSSQKGSRKKIRDLKQFWEQNPDIYGVRRSERPRKEPKRYTGTEESEESESPSCKRNARRKKANIHSSESEEESDSSEKRPPKSRTVNRYSKQARPKKRHPPTSDEDYTDDSDAVSKHKLRNKKKKVSYKEQSADETDSEDVVEYQEPQPVLDISDQSSETIEKVLAHRLGKVGATGGITTVYAVEDNGDPNDPNAEEKEVQYLIKWSGWAHIHNTWETEQTLKDQKANGLKKLENYIKKDSLIAEWKKNASPEDVEYFEIADEVEEQLRLKHLNVERIIHHMDTKKGDSSVDYYCKWEALPYQNCTWEADHIVSRHFQHIIDEYYARLKSTKIPSKVCKVLKHRPKFIPLKSQPSFLGTKDTMLLRDYQLEGLNWLFSSWCKENSVILADEMGLGKTIQTIAFLSFLFHEFELYGPFLIVVPLSTLAAWQKEFHEWAPELNCVAYIGNIPSREQIRQYEWCHPGNKRLKFNVLLTTYEIILKDKTFLSSVDWAVLAVDEAHRLKNDDSLLYKSLIDFRTNWRLLITGTPLQNSLKELWALLHFIMPHKFVCWEDFELEHKGADEKGYSKLHRQLEPFLLRRVKKDVEKSLPAKVERILRVGMTSVQKQYYKWILTKNYKELSKGQGNTQRFANIVMELKKCCNHASLIRPIDANPNLDPLQRLLRGSGKLLLLDKLLCKLNATGHRVLIFSQMVRMLDIIGDYLQLRHFPFQRLDGTIKGEIRKQALEHFNAPNSQDFCFLLSTRAGGLGINLATADTVIIFDSDWNPQNDLQAQARAHRIGQKNQVNIYRLATKNSVEEDILEKAKNKMVLDHLVIQRMEPSQRKAPSSNSGVPFNKEELSSILKFGAEELFKDDEGEEEVDIDDILSRAETREDQQVSASDELLSAFKMASFNFDEEEEISMSSLGNSGENKDKAWDEIIPLEERMKYEEERIKEETIDIGPRRSRKQTEKAKRSESDDEKQDGYTGSEAENSEEEEKPRKRGRPRLNPKDTIKGFNDAEIRRFVRSYKKFPNPLKRLESIAMDADLQDKNMCDLRKLAEQIHNNCHNLIKAKKENQEDGEPKTNKKRDRGPTFKLSGVPVNVKSVLAAESELEPLDSVIPADPEEREKWNLNTRFKEVHWDVPWTIKEDSSLLKGIYEHGMGNWEAIKMDSKLGLVDKILPDETRKPQAKNLQSRAEFLLKLLKKHLDLQKAGLADLGPKKTKKPRGEKKIRSDKQPKQYLSKATVENDDSNDSDTASSAKIKKGKQDKDKPVKSPEENSQQCEPAKKNKKDKEENSEKKPKKEKEKKEKKVQPVMHFTANAEPKIIDDANKIDEETFVQCKEMMRPMKKALKQLDNPDPKLTNDDQVKFARQCLIKIGNHINECLKKYASNPNLLSEWRCHLWTFVSMFTEFDAKKLYKLYKHAIRKEEKDATSTPASASANTTHSAGPSSPTGSGVIKTKKEKSHTSNERHDSPTSKKRPASDVANHDAKRAHYDNGKVKDDDRNADKDSYHRGSDKYDKHSKGSSTPNSYSTPPHRNYSGGGGPRSETSDRRSNWSGNSGYSKQERYNNEYHYNNRGPSFSSRDEGYKRDKDHRGPRRDNRYYHQGPPHHHNPYNGPPPFHPGYSSSQYSGGYGAPPPDYSSPYQQQGHGDSWRRKSDNFRPPFNP